MLVVASVHADEPPPDTSIVRRVPQSLPSSKGGASRSFDTMTWLSSKNRRPNTPLVGHWEVGWALLSTGTVGILSAFGFRALSDHGAINVFEPLYGKNTNGTSAPFSQVAFPVVMGISSGALVAIGTGLVIHQLTKRAVSTEAPHFPVFHVSVGPRGQISFGIQSRW